jgi:hypothetical protein
MCSQVYNLTPGIKDLFRNVEKKEIEKLKSSEKFIYIFRDAEFLFFEYKKREAVGAFTNEDFLFLS